MKTTVQELIDTYFNPEDDRETSERYIDGYYKLDDLDKQRDKVRFLVKRVLAGFMLVEGGVSWDPEEDEPTVAFRLSHLVREVYRFLSISPGLPDLIKEVLIELRAKVNDNYEHPGHGCVMVEVHIAAL